MNKAIMFYGKLFERFEKICHANHCTYFNSQYKEVLDFVLLKDLASSLVYLLVIRMNIVKRPIYCACSPHLPNLFKKEYAMKNIITNIIYPLFDKVTITQITCISHLMLFD